MTRETTVRTSFAWDVPCGFCGAAEGAPCVTAAGRPLRAGPDHADRWARLRLEYSKPRRYVLKGDDPRFGLAAGDVLVCEPYWLAPGLKLTVLYREVDGFYPSCNVYRREVDKVRGSAGRVSQVRVPA
jgi:hypothetical protein